ncbi:unnamed protein product [Rhizophagus irregularis]|nr:unnamed protein product [Rhizophagus irregularis]
MSSNFWAELSNDYEKLLETEIGYDVIIYAREEPNVKEIHAHSNILCIRSKYFSAAFSTEWAEKKDGKFILKKPNISPYIFNIILRFIYCGNIELKSLQGPDVLKLLIAVDELGVQRLISHIQEYLIEHQTEFLYQNPTGATIWVARIQGSKQLIGGYSPLDWEEDEEGGWKTTTDSFIYSFADGKIISTAKFGYVKNPKSTIYCFYDQGPHMGFLYCKSNNDWRNYDSKANCYPNVGIPISDFTVDYYEVFQVIKN